LKIGLDIGSTTIKCVAIDENNNIIYKNYERHYSKIKQKIDVGKISEEEGKMIAKELLEILKRDWNNPQIRADYEKWLKNKYKNL